MSDLAYPTDEQGRALEALLNVTGGDSAAVSMRGGDMIACVAGGGRAEPFTLRRDDPWAGVAEAWWGTARERCPRCGSEDIGTFGRTSERTDLDVAELAECAACGFEAERGGDAAVEEARQASVLGPRGWDRVARGVA